MIGLVFGISVFLLLSITAYIIYNKWYVFKDLRPGDSCGRFIDFESVSEPVIEEIVKVDTDENGYTTRIYTINNSYTFLDFIRNSIMAIYD